MQSVKVNRLAGIIHPEYGRADHAPAGIPFDPLWFLTCPGRFKALQRFARKRAAKALRRGQFGTRAGEKECDHSGRVTKEQRESMLDEAVTAYMDFFMHRDYAAAGIDNDNVFGAVMSAAAWLDRARWRHPDTTRHGEREERGFYPYALPTDPSPDRIAAAGETLGIDPETAAAAIIGTGTDEGDTRRAVGIPGGPSGRGATDGRMVWAETVTRQWIEVDSNGDRTECTETEGEWKMKRGRGRKRDLPAAVVIDSPPADARRYVRHPIPAARPAETAGPRSMVRHMVADTEAYRAELAEYYAGKD
jgi:hypothetical protein